MNTNKYYILLLVLFWGLPSLSYNQTLLTDSLKAYYKFDQNTLDYSGHQNHLVNDSSLDWSTFFRQDIAVYMDGTMRTQSVGSFNNSYFTESAISVWVLVSPNSNNQKQVMVQGAYMRFGVYIAPNNTAAVFFNTPSASAQRDTTNLADSTWHHIVAQNNGDTTFLYVDGQLKGKKYQALGVGNGRANNKLYIGNSNLNTLPYSGSINDLRIYNRLLTQKEIDSLSTYPTLSVSIDQVKNQYLKTVIFPNPTNSLTSISFDSNFQGGQLNVRNIAGQLLSTYKIKSQNKVDIELTGKNGLYFIELIDIKGNKSVSKVIKN